MLRYHAQAVTLLPAAPGISLANAALLEQREAELKTRLPDSLREWYSLDNSVELLRQFSNDDRPVPIHRLGAPMSSWYGVNHRDFMAQSLLLIMQENQGVCNWAVQLDGTTDPSVVVAVDTAPNEIWLPLAQSFSQFVYCQIWDHPRMSACCGAQESDLALADLEFLRSTFQEGPSTHSWPGSWNYRFTTPWGRILIWRAEDGGTDWHLNCKSGHDLIHLLEAVWHCGTLSKTLYGQGRESELCLAQFRQSKS